MDNALWLACFAALTLGLRELGNNFLPPLLRVTRGSREVAGLQATTRLLLELEETLSAGLVPAREKWGSLKRLPAPWGRLSSESVQALRAQGGAILPTLRRLRSLADSHLAALSDARAKTAQAVAQSGVCIVLVPLFGGALYWLLPGLDRNPYTWLAICGAALILGVSAGAWLFHMSEQARWAGLPADKRAWVLEAQCAGERFLASVRAGNPADLAWTRTVAVLAESAPELATYWGANVWASNEKDRKASAQALRGSLQLLGDAGEAFRRAIAVSVMEGRPCSERIEAALQGLAQDLRARVERELVLLPTRSLKPLFALVAPALFGMLAIGIGLCWKEVMSGGL
jgi:hypothetical protein